MICRIGPPSWLAPVEGLGGGQQRSCHQRVTGQRRVFRSQGHPAYVARNGLTEEAYLEQLGDLLTPEMAGSALVDLIRTDPVSTVPGYLLTGAGLKKLP